VPEQLVLAGLLLASADSPLQRNAGLRIVDGRIAEIADNAQLQARHPGVDVVDARSLLLMPGLVNAHMHAYGLLAHGLLPPVPLDGFLEFLEAFWWPHVENRLDAPMIDAALTLACCEMIRSGVTTFCDVLEAPHAPHDILQIEEGIVRRAGLRAALMTEASERIDTAHGMMLQQQNARFVQAHQQDELVRGMLCLHTSFTCSQPFVERARRLRDDLDCRLHLHLSESDDEPAACEAAAGIRPVHWYDRVGLWGPRTLASQVVAVDPSELAVLADRGAETVHMPLSNCEVGGGVAPVPAMIAAGLRPALGTDGYVNNMFEVMRAAFLIHKGVARDASVMPARLVVRMATEWGARATGFPSCGRLVPGAAADIIGLDSTFSTPLTSDNAFDQVVLYRNPEHVRLSIVGGRLLMQDRALQTLDENAARATAEDQAKRLWEAI